MPTLQSAQGADSSPDQGSQEGGGAATKTPGGWTLFKRKQVERLEAARARGVSYAQLIAVSHGRLTETTIIAALNAGKLSRGEWQGLTAALDELEAAG